VWIRAVRWEAGYLRQYRWCCEKQVSAGASRLVDVPQTAHRLGSKRRGDGSGRRRGRSCAVVQKGLDVEIIRGRRECRRQRRSVDRPGSASVMDNKRIQGGGG